MKAPTAKQLERELAAIPNFALTHLPGAVGRALRARYWRARLGGMGARCIIDVGVVIDSPENVFLGDDVWLDSYVRIAAGPNLKSNHVKQLVNPAFRGMPGQVHLKGGNHIASFCILQGHGGLSIGRDVGVAAHSIIYSLSNHYRSGKEDDVFESYESVIKFAVHPAAHVAYVQGPVVLDDASGLGPHSIVLPGSTIGKYSWIGPGSVVRGAIPEGVIAGGNPATVQRQRFSNSPPAR